MSVHYIPKGLNNITPYLLADDADKLITFLQAVFDAVIEDQFKMPDGKTAHAQLRIGDSVIMLGGKPGATGNDFMLYVYVKDVDAVYKKALAMGGISVMEPVDQFYGDRSATVKDAFGHQWCIATHIEDVSDEEMQKRAKAYKGC